MQVSSGPTSESSFRDAHGVSVTYYVWEADHERAVVQIAHGFGEHAGRYDELAHRLNAAGFTVYADDHRGHGRTAIEQWDGRVERIGYLGPGGIRATVAEIVQLSAIIHAQRPGRPLVLVAHSWGSVLAQMILNARFGGYDGVVLSGTVYRMPGSMGGGDLNARFRVTGGTGFEWLSRDEQVVRAAAADPWMPLVNSLKTLSFTDTLRQFGRPARRLPQVPLLIMVGSEDAFGGTASATRLAEAFRRRSGLNDVQLTVYSGARHEIFNETNREEVFKDLVRWLDSTTTPSTDPGGME